MFIDYAAKVIIGSFRVLFCSRFKSITSQMIPDLVVLSYNELDTTVEVFSDGMVKI